MHAPSTRKPTAGGTLNMAGSMIDLNAAITGAQGLLKARPIMTKATPGAGNI